LTRVQIQAKKIPAKWGPRKADSHGNSLSEVREGGGGTVKVRKNPFETTTFKGTSRTPRYSEACSYL